MTRRLSPATPSVSHSITPRLRFRLLAATGIGLSVMGVALVVSFLALRFSQTPGLAEAAVEPLAPASIVEMAVEAPPAAEIVPEISAELLQEVIDLPPSTQPFTGTVVRRVTNVNVTFYDCAVQGFCGNMYNGRRVYEGAAACSWNMALGTRFRIVGDPTQRIYVCEDRGLLANTWVDIFFYYPTDGYLWQTNVGRHGVIEILE